jgi:hypothetical protein
MCQEFTKEYHLALQDLWNLRNLKTDEEARRLGQIRQKELVQRYMDDLKVMGEELVKSYWASVNAYGVPDAVPIEDRDRELYDRRDAGFRYYDGVRYYSGLAAHGDYTKMKLIIRSRKQDYNLGELVYIKFYARNDSDNEVHIKCIGGRDSLVWKLFHSNYDEAVKTTKWEEEYQSIRRKVDYNDYAVSGRGWRGGLNAFFPCFKLQQGQEHELDWVPLNDYYDLSKPDTYELTCFRWAFIGGQYYEPMIQSNTLTFRILEGDVQKPVATKGEDKLPHTNPPPGGEVFKQPKPPKNTFYITVPHGYTIPIDVSPAAMRRQWEKERDAKAAQPPDAVKPVVE